MVRNYLLFLLGVLENLVYFGDMPKIKKNAPFAVILETISNKEVVYLCEIPNFRSCQKKTEKKLGFSPPYCANPPVSITVHDRHASLMTTILTPGTSFCKIVPFRIILMRNFLLLVITITANIICLSFILLSHYSRAEIFY